MFHWCELTRNRLAGRPKWVGGPTLLVSNRRIDFSKPVVKVPHASVFNTALFTVASSPLPSPPEEERESTRRIILSRKCCITRETVASRFLGYVQVDTLKTRCNRFKFFDVLHRFGRSFIEQ
jgi:hypothetical protein